MRIVKLVLKYARRGTKRAAIAAYVGSKALFKGSLAIVAAWLMVNVLAGVYGTAKTLSGNKCSDRVVVYRYHLVFPGYSVGCHLGRYLSQEVHSE